MDNAALEEAVACFEAAARISLQGIGNLTYTFSMLALTLKTRFEQGGVRADLDDCITKYGEGLELTPPEHPDRSMILMNLAKALWTRFKLVGDRADLDDCITKSEKPLNFGHLDTQTAPSVSDP